MSIDDLRTIHAHAMHRLDDLLEALSPADLSRPTPCADWNLGQLLAHMIGQNLGFARALNGETTTVADYAPSNETWAASATALNSAVATVKEDAQILLPEFSADVRFDAETTIGFQVVDTVIHGWDVATALGQPFRPDDHESAVVHAIAEAVPAQASGTDPSTPFGPVLTHPGTDPWRATLARLGRNPDWAP